MITRKHGCNPLNSCKIAALVLLGILLSSVLFAQEELTFVAEIDTVAYDWDGVEVNEFVMRAGDLISTNAEVTFGPLSVAGGGFHLQIFFGELHEGRSTLAKFFRPVDTDDVFGTEIFIDHPIELYNRSAACGLGWSVFIGDSNAMWVPYYYRDILMEQDREMLLDIRPRLANIPIETDGRLDFWYESTLANIQNGRAMFYNSVIMLGMGTHIAVRNIRRTDFGYIVDGAVSTLDIRWHGEFLAALAGTPFWNTYRPGEAVTLLLYLDGEYLDIYTSSGIHVATYIRVGREFIAQYQSLIRTNTSDLTNVQWPSRADGSTGTRPRPEPSPAQPVAGDDAEEPVKIPAADIAGDIPEQEIVVAQDITDATPPLPWALPAVIAGAVIIVVGVALAVAKRKRKREEPF